MEWNILPNPERNRIEFRPNMNADFYREYLKQPPRKDSKGKPLAADLKFRASAQRIIDREEKRLAENKADAEWLANTAIAKSPELKAWRKAKNLVKEARTMGGVAEVQRANSAVERAEAELLETEAQHRAGEASKVEFEKQKIAVETARAALEQAQRDQQLGQKLLPIRKKQLRDADDALIAKMNELRKPLATLALKQMKVLLETYSEVFDLERSFEKIGKNNGSTRCTPLERETVKKWVAEMESRFNSGFFSNGK